MEQTLFPVEIANWIGGNEVGASTGRLFNKVNPHNGTTLCQAARSDQSDLGLAIDAAKQAFRPWADTPGVRRGEILSDLALGLRAHRQDIARIVALETGKSYASALGETDGAIALGMFMAGEGQRLYGRTTTSGTPHKYAMTVREPLGVAGLIVAANTPIANVAWKVFPALICGNSVVLKAAEDTPVTAWIFGKIAKEVGLPDGVLNVLQGFGHEVGAALVANAGIQVVSFTGSTAVGREIAMVAGKRMTRVSLELGGKNPLVVCDDADLESATAWVLLSAFSNAGQRCASGSRIIVFDSVYECFCKMLIEGTKSLSVGPAEEDDLGPVINEAQLENMLEAIRHARERGATVLVGGDRLTGPAHREGFYMSPTLIENVALDDRISTTELFGPVACLYRVGSFAEALAAANDSPYGLTACIHTSSVHRAIEFSHRVESGVVVVNAGTYGSEAHMPFGGVKQSGNGSREPGTEALDVYSNLKDIYMTVDPLKLDAGP